MNRPYAQEVGTHTRDLDQQEYYFPPLPEGEAPWCRAQEVMCEDMAFHETLAEHGVTVIIHPDWSITYKNNWGGHVPQKYSALVKAIWDTPSCRAVLEDYGIRLVRTDTKEVVA